MKMVTQPQKVAQTQALMALQIVMAIKYNGMQFSPSGSNDIIEIPIKNLQARCENLQHWLDEQIELHGLLRGLKI